MPQTILAVLAMMVAIFIANQQNRGVLQSQLSRIRGDIAVHATSVAEDMLSEIGAKAFDENTVGESTVEGPSGLTSESKFGPNQEAGGRNDIDDFHGQVLKRTRTIDADSLSFQVEVKISYADEDDTEEEVAGPTRIKKANLRVYSLDVSKPDTIRVSQSFSCGGKCAGAGW